MMQPNGKDVSNTIMNVIFGGLLQIVEYTLDIKLVGWLRVGNKLGCVVDCKCNVKVSASGRMMNCTNIGNQNHVLNFNVKWGSILKVSLILASMGVKLGLQFSIPNC
jgi:hypothetical protein